jgi:transcriptional regulator with GAF, ATPase, and Fis domain
MKRAKESQPHFDKIVREATECKNRDDFSKAIERYEQAIRIYSHSRQSGQPLSLSSLFIELADCYSKGGAGLDQNRFASRLAGKPVSRPDDELSGRHLYCSAAIHFSKSEFRKALVECEESLKVLNGLSADKTEIGFVSNLMGHIYKRLNQYKESKRYYEDARSLFRIMGDEKKFMQANGNLGVCYWKLSNWVSAKECYEPILEYSETDEGRWAYIPVRINLGLAHFKLGEWNEAGECFDEAVRYSEETGNQLRLARSLICRGMLLSAKRMWKEADRQFRKAMKISRENGFHREFAIGCEQFGQLLFEKGDYPRAIDYFDRGLEIGETIAPDGDHSSILTLRAETLLRLGKVDPARVDAERGLAIFRKCGNRFEEGRFHRVLGQIFSEIPDRENAKKHFITGIRIFYSIRARYELAKCHLEYARHTVKSRTSYRANKTSLKHLLEARGVALEIAGADHLSGQIEMEIGRVRAHVGEEDFAIESYARAEELFRKSKDPVRIEEVDRLMNRIMRDIVKENRSCFTKFRSHRTGQDRSGVQVQQICQDIVDKVSLDRAFLSVQTHEKRFVIPYRTRNITEEKAKQLTYGLLSPELRLVREGEPIYIVNPSSTPEVGGIPESEQKKIHSLIVIPFGDRSEIDGLLYLDRTIEGKNRPFNGREFKQVLDRYETLSELILKIQRERLREGQKKSIDFELHGIIAEDPKFLSVLYDIQHFVRCKQILIQGESGTGKELVARLIHSQGPRGNKPFEAINCATLNENLYGSELFGHAAGAFTDAKKERRGIFEEADGGMIFLDEIDKMLLSVQNGLLRAIEYGEIRRYGENGIRKVNVAVICASSRDIREQVDDGKFLKELYFRINRPSVFLPPLRERPKDIPKLIDHFIGLINDEFDRDIKGITKRAKELLMGYFWPGNVRDLIGVLKETSLRARDGEEITEFGLFKVLPELREAKIKEKRPKEVITEFEKRLILKALLESNWNVALAARILGLADGTLRYKIKVKHGGLEKLKSCALEDGIENEQRAYSVV